MNNHCVFCEVDGKCEMFNSNEDFRHCDDNGFCEVSDTIRVVQCPWSEMIGFGFEEDSDD